MNRPDPARNRRPPTSSNRGRDSHSTLETVLVRLGAASSPWCTWFGMAPIRRRSDRTPDSAANLWGRSS